MKGVTFSTHTNDGSVWSLLGVFALLAKQTGRLSWHVKGLEFTPSPAADRAQSLSDDGLYSYQDVLVALALNPQLIGGVFIGAEETSSQVTLKIETVRGDEWNIYSTNPELLKMIQRNISSATAIPG